MERSPSDEQEDQSDQEHREGDERRYSLLLPPANPIITKNISIEDQKVTFKIQNTSENTLDFAGANFATNKPDKPKIPASEPNNQKTSPNPPTQKTIINEQYRDETLLYKRYNNDQCNQRDKIKYLTSMFLKKQSTHPLALPEAVGTLKDDQLQFDSNFQSGNLMLVYKVIQGRSKKGPNVYDLLLQNDINTGGLTQWYYFRVKNKRHNFVAKFNIVNLYKSDSLYNKGMKPCVYSQRSDRNKKNWRRRGFNIYYEHNDLAYQDNPKKHYKTLSFQYDFTVQNDTVFFAHSMPYTTNDLKILLEEIKSNTKVNLQSFGTTGMNKPMPLIKISSTDKTVSSEKKIIVILARQHPGQTVGSYICSEVIVELLKNSPQTDFLSWRYDIYIIPMVNIDGVYLGNYRGNLAGFDLNRCWQKTDSKLHPEVHAIKALIKRLRRKQQIELILDLHGHSRKMGSFFYGNNFGKNPMVFPYIASKTNSNILFQESRFTSQRGTKAETARVVLGKMIKDCGNVYTYEVSFYGYYKNDKLNPFSYNQTHYKDIGKSLVLSMYRTYMQLYKQEKTLKESIFLKNIKQEIQVLKASSETLEKQDDSGSDSEAQSIMAEESDKLKEFHQDQIREEEKQQQEQQEEKEMINESVLIKSKELKSDVLGKESESKKSLKGLLGNFYGKEYYDVRNIIKSRFPSIDHEPLKSEQQLEEELQQHHQDHQGFHPYRLKVYGQTYELRSRIAHIQKEGSMQNKLRKDVKKELKTLQNKSSVNSSKDIIFERKQLMKSLNTINHGTPPPITLSKQLKIKEKDLKYKNKSLTLKEVVPDFNEHLESNNAKINFEMNRIKEQQYKNKVVVDYVKRTLKLPHL